MIFTSVNSAEASRWADDGAADFEDAGSAVRENHFRFHKPNI